MKKLTILCYINIRNMKTLDKIWCKEEKIKHLTKIIPDSYLIIIWQGNNFRITENHSLKFLFK